MWDLFAFISWIVQSSKLKCIDMRSQNLPKFQKNNEAECVTFCFTHIQKHSCIDLGWLSVCSLWLLALKKNLIFSVDLPGRILWSNLRRNQSRWTNNPLWLVLMVCLFSLGLSLLKHAGVLALFWTLLRIACGLMQHMCQNFPKDPTMGWQWKSTRSFLSDT